MSEYFRVLKRLENERRMRQTPASDAQVATAPAQAATAPAATEPAARIAPAMGATPAASNAPVVSHAPAPPVESPVAPAPPMARSAAPARRARKRVSPPPVAAVPDGRPREAIAPWRDVPPVPAAPDKGPERRHEAGPVKRPESPAPGWPGIVTLFDNIRTLGEPHSRRVLVFAGASRAEPARPIIAELAAHAERQGVPAACAVMVQQEGRATLTLRRHDTTDVSARDDVAAVESSIDLNGGAAPAAMATWLERSAPEPELILIEAPPLAESIDAALLACGCDGLIVVAEPEVTSREDLQLAAKRAQLAGCRTLGVVMSAGPTRVPAWLRRMWSAAGWRPTS